MDVAVVVVVVAVVVCATKQGKRCKKKKAKLKQKKNKSNEKPFNRTQEQKREAKINKRINIMGHFVFLMGDETFTQMSFVPWDFNLFTVLFHS